MSGTSTDSRQPATAAMESAQRTCVVAGATPRLVFAEAALGLNADAVWRLWRTWLKTAPDYSAAILLYGYTATLLHDYKHPLTVCQLVESCNEPQW